MPPVLSRQLAIGGSASLAAAALLYALRPRRTSQKPQKKPQQQDPDTKAALKVDRRIGKVGVDAVFFRQLRYIFKICVPSWRSKTILIIVAHSFFLILRTYLSVVVAWIDGKLVKDMVARDSTEFFKGLVYWFGIAVPATFTNSMIRYCQSKLAFALRQSLTAHVHKIYMENNTYYKAINLDNRIDGADQLITTDIDRFCTALASLYSNLGKPVLDMIIFNYQISRTIGLAGMGGLSLNWMITAAFMRAITPAFGKMAAQEAKLEGDFRTAHSRLITNAEEIAFYNGEELEKSILNRTYTRLIKHINHIYNVRIAYNMFEDFLIKYSWSAVGLMIASIPVFFPNLAGRRTKREAELLDAEERAAGGGEGGALAQAVADGSDKRTGTRTQNFVTNKRLMMSLADAGGRIMYSYKELSELAGYTYRVYNLLRVVDDLHDDRYLNTQEQTGYSSASSVEERFSIEHIDGEIVYSNDRIEFDRIPVVTPAGDTMLTKDLSFSLQAGDHLMITGPNGAGKTAILRILAGLWPVFRGRLTAPRPSSLRDIFYIPQRPYLVLGTLRDQVIYPHSRADMIAAGKTDADLAKVLKIVYLDYIPAREGGWDAVKEWKDVFSGGEKQRVQLARMFYHHPRFCVLDEATSAVSTDVEALLYTAAKDAGITMVTISHRPTLFKYHSALLTVTGPGDGAKYRIERIGTDDGAEKVARSLEEELRRVETQLAETEKLRARLGEVNSKLSLEVKVGGGSDDGELVHAKRTLV
ncbi:ABC transporter transmembrane region 2-domain-containing protein [Cladochytrium replicatum]|nr:ABC transporter transmembrane region 2-domain-containing protein [Cladochytrium replicatum]